MNQEAPPPSSLLWTLSVRNSNFCCPLIVPINPNEPVSQVLNHLNEEYDLHIEPGYCKVFFRGKLLNLIMPVCDTILQNRSEVLLVYSLAQQVEGVETNLQQDFRLRSMSEEEDRPKQHQEEEQQDAVFKFCSIKSCARFKTPHPFEATRLLERLSVDPAIKHLMKKYKWTVGSLEEMDPKTDMIALRKQFEEGACVLGYNENAGHKIFLRLRSDSETSFRSYKSLINTLLHELTHNVHGPHDEQFWSLFAKLKKEYLDFHLVERSGSNNGKRGDWTDLTQGQVEREIRNQGAGNSALLLEERQAALKSISKQQQKQPSLLPPANRLGAVNSRARIMEREKLAKAAETRILQHQDQNKTQAVIRPPTSPPKNSVEPDFDSQREVKLRQGVVELCRLQPVEKRNAVAALLYAIVKNALSGQDKYLQLKTTSQKFQVLGSVGESLLQVIGFSYSNTRDHMVLKYDSAFLNVTKRLLEETGLISVIN